MKNRKENTFLYPLVLFLIMLITRVSGLSNKKYIRTAKTAFLNNDLWRGLNLISKGKNRTHAAHNYGYSGNNSLDSKMNELRERVISKNVNEPEFLQAFEEVLECLKPVFKKDNIYLGVLE
ncbi:NADP-specific glutamate dehydrogenase, putative, partial [Hepatocystis sp. ex Piliocolobus tephrosceles]